MTRSGWFGERKRHSQAAKGKRAYVMRDGYKVYKRKDLRRQLSLLRGQLKLWQERYEESFSSPAERQRYAGYISDTKKRIKRFKKDHNIR